MANKQVKSVLETNKDIRNASLQNNGGKYNLHDKELNVIVGKSYNIYANEKNPVIFEQNPDLLRFTHGGKTEYSKDTHEKYGLDSENLMYYVHSNLKPSYKVNNYDGFKDYMSYMFDVYGVEESYAGYLAGLLGVRDLAENLAYDIVPDFKGKTAQDVINEILQYSSVEYAMERDRVGVVKDINVAMAVAGQVTTNINNYSGKESKMGLISNIMYGTTLLKAANFNSLRRTNYITSDLNKLYGNNLNNVYSLSSLFRVSDETGRIIDPVIDKFIGEVPSGNVFDYLLTVNPEFRLPDSGYDWSKYPNYGSENKYYEISKAEEFGDYNIPETEDWTNKNSDRQVNKGNGNDTFKVYSEGMHQGESYHPLPQQETSDGFIVEPIRNIEKSNILKKTNEFLALKRAKTMISRFHDTDNIENSLIQSAVYKNFGISHGRNLLTKDSYANGTPSSVVNTYTNPYCRVWTNHHQFSKMKHLIRPFTNEGNFVSISDLQKNWIMFRSDDGAKRLSDYTVLNKNGMVNITPSFDDVDIKKCMFSIENLAWKDVLTDRKGRYRYDVNGELMEDNESTLSDEQRGPNGGRIMWFPPYDLTFQETASAKWSENEFIGRGEPVFTYINSTRSGTLEFTILVDHPSVLNYWLMNKENTEENEQTLLRYFAGCEMIDPDEDVVEQALYELSKGRTKDPEEVNAERDIVFYTFFPNNFSGVDMSAEEAMERIFGGQGNAEKVVKSNNDNLKDETFFLGYEMGVNPMSINSFNFVESTRNETWYLDEIYNLADAEKKFEDLSVFQQKEQLSISGITKGETNTITVTINDLNDFNLINNGYNDRFEDIYTYEFRIIELEEEIGKIDEELMTLEDKLYVLTTDIEDIEKGTSAYFSVEYQISVLKEEILALQKEKLNKEKQKDTFTSTVENINENQDELLEHIEKVGEVIDCNQEFTKTNPLFIYFDYNGGAEFSGATVMTSASDAYAKYKANNLKTYITNDKPYEFLTEKDKVACCTKRNKNANPIYWVVKCVESPNIFFMPFNNKKEFTKSNFDIGCKNNNKEYYVKFGGQTFVFTETKDKKTGKTKTAQQNATIFIEKNNILKDFINKQSFEESGKLMGQNTELHKYYHYDFEETDQNGVYSKIKATLDDKGNDDYIVKNYYENHKYGCLSDFGYKQNYGVIQFYYTGKIHPTGENYETIQDFIARHEIVSGETQYNTNISSSATTKYVTTQAKDKRADVTGEIYWDEINPELSYPVDKGKETEKLANKNYYDTKSFGLNSTLEVVKKELGDDSITYSFGEVYAALKGEKEKEFVLSCERGILKNVLKYTGVELEEKVKEAEERIDYLKNIFNPKDGLKTSDITEVLTLGTASSHGSDSKNEKLSNDRENTIKSFLKTFSMMKDIDMSKVDTDGIDTNEIINVDDADKSDISGLSAKKGRHTRVTIVLGEKDITNNQLKKAEEDDKRKQEEIKVKKKNRRYDNERLFFSMLKENDNIAYKRLVDKVKYFSPAFHSITPEGFNARLTFLQQCTRQGPTSTASDMKNGSTASNLAFGRAPFCVLRLGDFLNTKIVITSVNITYPDSMWDLNPEGIGVQFMMAKVSMQIHILGGSDLSAPIKRLQNAVSFNYYANTSVYDNRSDNAIYSNGGIQDTKQWFVELNDHNDLK